MIDVAILADSRIRKMEHEKTEKHQGLKEQLGQHGQFPCWGYGGMHCQRKNGFFLSIAFNNSVWLACSDCHFCTHFIPMCLSVLQSVSSHVPLSAAGPPLWGNFNMFATHSDYSH